MRSRCTKTRSMAGETGQRVSGQSGRAMTDMGPGITDVMDGLQLAMMWTVMIDTETMDTTKSNGAAHVDGLVGTRAAVQATIKDMVSRSDQRACIM